MAKSNTNGWIIWKCKFIYIQYQIKIIKDLILFRWVFTKTPCGNKHHLLKHHQLTLLLPLVANRYVIARLFFFYSLRSSLSPTHICRAFFFSLSLFSYLRALATQTHSTLYFFFSLSRHYRRTG